MAQEMGRQEQKLNRLLAGGGGSGPGGGGGPLPDLDWLRPLLEILTSIDGPGGYEISGPCNPEGPGSEGEPLRAEWGMSVGLERALLKRMDALAELLQHHKNLRQPICPPGRAMGTPVTVTFEELPEE